MPKHVLTMLDNLISNGADQDIQTLGEGVKASLEILSEMKDEIVICSEHIKDKDLHTPKGLLVRAKVIGWALFIVVVVSTIVAYLPEKIAMLTP